MESNTKTFSYTQGALDGISIEGSVLSASGWVVGLEDQVTGLGFECDQMPCVIEDVAFNLPSPDVHQVFPRIPQTESCRFRLTTHLPELPELPVGQGHGHLYSVVPQVGHHRGVPLERILPVNLAIPRPDQSVAVGHGDFLETSFSMLSLFRLIANLTRDARVLDPGCGIGRIAFALFHYLSKNGRYTGFDVSEPAIDLARQIFSKASNFRFEHVGLQNKMYNPKGTIKAAKFTFPFNSGDFDFAVMTSVFTHLLTAETQQYLKEISRTLVSGGSCFATFFVLDEFAKRSVDKRQASLNIAVPIGEGCYVQDKEVPEGAVAYEYRFLSDLIAKAGLIIEAIHWGSWSGRRPYLSYQDIFLLRKP